MTSTEYMYYRLNEHGTTTGMENLDRWPSNEERRVDRTDLPDGVWVSTVFLVLDHGYGGDPLLFETMIFGGDHDQYCDRYATLAEARAGHERVVAALREGRDPERGVMTSLQPHDLRGALSGLVTIHPGRAWATLLPLLSNAHIPDPDQIDIADVTVSLLYDSDHRHHRRPEQAVDHARQMATALGLLDFREHPDGSIHTWSGWLYGEHWVVTAYTPRKQHSAGVAGYPVGTRHPQDPNEGVSDAP